LRAAIKLSRRASVYAGEMLIATAAAAALVATSLAAGAMAPVTMPAPPPIVVTVSVADDVPPSLVALTVAEAEAIFRTAGISFIWRFGPPALTTLTVAIGNERGVRQGTVTALGWIVFEDGRPDQQIYLSYANAQQFLFDARAVVGNVLTMPNAEKEMMLGRTMGRALAHELGHYLLASKVHTQKGLMKAVRSAQEFFSSDRRRFQLEPVQRLQIATRLRADEVIASRRTPGSRRARGGTSQ
jgi:hypothetical protein